jgi:hypothetical protein
MPFQGMQRVDHCGLTLIFVRLCHAAAHLLARWDKGGRTICSSLEHLPVCSGEITIVLTWFGWQKDRSDAGTHIAPRKAFLT